MAQLSAAAARSEQPAWPRPTDDQHQAADPASSVWVSASAGTGKTRVLSNRLLRLLLDGADPANILCLTYTKAGAAEMARRVQDDLAELAVLPEAELLVALEALIGRRPTLQEVSRAKNGLLVVLDLPAGLRIMTIHSFCQSLLHRFPLEAGVSPHFDLLEPRAAAGLRRKALDAVLIERTPALQDAIRRLAVALGEHSLGDGLAALDQKRDQLSEAIAVHGGDMEAVIAEVFSTLGVEPGLTVERLRMRMVDHPALDEPALSAAASALAGGTKTDAEAGERIRSWIGAERDGRLAQLHDYRLAFLTKDSQPRKRLASKGVSEAFAQVMPVLEAEQDRLEALAVREKALKIAEKTAALLRVGAAIIRVYERRKQAEGLLDYADLIACSRRLLAETEAADWVRYKLDQRIDHLLIDESQDTSPVQWAIIQALIADFWVGEGARSHPPTLFVVGDEKQSIFGFQGANVETYQRLRGELRTRAEAANMAFCEPLLKESFRSAQAILDAADAVFEHEAMARGVHSGDGPMRHQAFDRTAKGLVEVWPLIEADEEEDAEPWALPDRQSTVDSAERKLARTIAEQIRQWLNDKVRLINQDRPVDAGDVMILLPRRGVLQDVLVRELKRNNVPVAGADRIELVDELAVRDLMALGDALLLPEDDLILATLLRSPLFDITEDQLFELAHERGERSIFRRLGDLRERHPSVADADDRLRRWLALVDTVPPFEFFSRALTEGAPSGRRRLLRRLGPAVLLPIEAFLAQAIAYERANPPSMQGFLHWLRADSEAIKRDAEEGREEVRIMTVHGAKGLEAPIVFLADATYRKTLQKERLLWREDGLPIWKVAEKDRDPASQRLCAQEEARQQAEHRRLLYVAMTRARERLIVAGCARRRKGEGAEAPSDWYDMIRSGLAQRTQASVAETALPGGMRGEVLRFGDAPVAPLKAGQAALPFALDGQGMAPLPDWLAAAARGEVEADPLRPSADPLAEDPPAESPLSDERRRRFGRGLLVHKLLQILPDLPASAHPAAIGRYLEKPGLDLEPQLRGEIAHEVGRILDDPAFARLFGPSSRAEVALVGEIFGRRVSGQVDRLAVLDDEVLVIDYKTNRPPPRLIEDVLSAYGRQMAIYRALLRQIYPEKRVRCALLWTEGPRLMPLDDAWLDGFGGS